MLLWSKIRPTNGGVPRWMDANTIRDDDDNDSYDSIFFSSILAFSSSPLVNLICHAIHSIEPSSRVCAILEMEGRPEDGNLRRYSFGSAEPKKQVLLRIKPISILYLVNITIRCYPTMATRIFSAMKSRESPDTNLLRKNLIVIGIIYPKNIFLGAFTST